MPVRKLPSRVILDHRVATRLGGLVPVGRLRRRPAGAARTLLLQLAHTHYVHRPTRFRSIEVANGIRLSGTTADMIQRYIFLFGAWEPPLTAYAQSRLRPGDVFLDFGANIGYFSLLAAKAVGPGGHVVSFECVPSILEQLERNIADNGLGNVTVRPVIAGDAAGEGEVFVASADNTGRSGTMELDGARSEGRVPRVVAHEAVPRELWDRVRLVKIDVEGDELGVLRGLDPVLAQLRAGASVVVEVSPERLEARGQTAAALMEHMRSRGFSAAELPNGWGFDWYTHPRPPALVPIDGTPTRQMDVVFTR